jgi:hypothetical protein
MFRGVHYYLIFIYFYRRGTDGNIVYNLHIFPDELKQLFESTGLIQEQNLVDRRLQVNRVRMLKMYRVWVQAKFRKPSTTTA